MKNKSVISLVISGLLCLSSAAFASAAVPEIDGGSAALALCLTVGALALLRERLRRR